MCWEMAVRESGHAHAECIQSSWVVAGIKVYQEILNRGDTRGRFAKNEQLAKLKFLCYIIQI